MPQKHKKVSTLPDLPDDLQVRPSDWNADHVLTGGADGDIVVRDTARDGLDGQNLTKIPQLVAVRFNQPPPASPQDGDEWTVRTGVSPNRTITHYVRDGGVTYIGWEILV